MDTSWRVEYERFDRSRVTDYFFSVSHKNGILAAGVSCVLLNKVFIGWNLLKRGKRYRKIRRYLKGRVTILLRQKP